MLTHCYSCYYCHKLSDIILHYVAYVHGALRCISFASRNDCFSPLFVMFTAEMSGMIVSVSSILYGIVCSVLRALFFLEVDSIIISLRCTWYRGRALRGHCRDMAGWRLSRQGESERGSLLSGSKAPLPLVGVVVSRHCVVARVSCQPPRKRRVKFCGKP